MFEYSRRSVAPAATGRAHLLYPAYTQKRDVTARLAQILSMEGLRVAVLRADIKPESPEAGYEKTRGFHRSSYCGHAWARSDFRGRCRPRGGSEPSETAGDPRLLVSSGDGIRFLVTTGGREKGYHSVPVAPVSNVAVCYISRVRSDRGE